MTKLLIVGDHEPLVKLIQGDPEGINYQCKLVSDATEAKKQLKSTPYDLLITAFSLPEESSVDLAKYVKKVFVNTAIIVILSADDTVSNQSALDISFHGYIINPLDPRHLFLALKNARQQLRLEQAERNSQQNHETRTKVKTSELVNNDRRFRDLIESSVWGVLIYWQRKLLYVNQSFLNLFHYTEEELGQLDTITEIAAPEERERLACFEQDRLDGKPAPSRYEFRGVRKDGTNIWIENCVQKVIWDGQPAIQFTSVDITTRKEGEVALRRNDDYQKTILDSVITGVLVIDEHTNLIIDANAYAINLIGAHKNQVVGKHCNEFFASKEKREYVLKAFKNQGIYQKEQTLRQINGDIIPILETIKQIKFNNRSYILDNFIDLREHKKAEEAQKEQLHFLSKLMDDIPFPLYFKERNGVYRLWNIAYEKFQGTTAKEVIGKTVFDIYPLDVAKRVKDHDEAFFENHTIQSYVIHLPDQSGQVRDMSVTKTIYFKRDGSIGGLIGLMMDITNKNRMEEELRQAQKLKSIGQLSAGIAHEINTPIQYVSDNTSFLKEAFKDMQTVLDSYSKLLETVKQNTQYEKLTKGIIDTLDTADIEYMMDEIPQAIEQSLEGVERVTSIVQSLKEFSHPEESEKTQIDINKAIETTIAVSRNEWKYVADIKTELDKSIPLVSCFPGELNQVFLNIIVNASHALDKNYSDINNSKGQIHISTITNAETAEIRIRDNGCGIPQDIQHRIFDPFFTTKGVGKGTGQGLSIAHKVITEKHMGTITCESEEGKGTSFIIQLPL